MNQLRHQHEDSGSGFVVGLLCGTALGAAIALMFAPKAGADLREALYDSADDIKKKAFDMVAKGREAVDRGRQAFESARESATEAGNELYKQGHEVVSDLSSRKRPAAGV
jgi:gas vesicle protein